MPWRLLRVLGSLVPTSPVGLKATILFSSPPSWRKQQLSGVVLHGQAPELLWSPQATIRRVALQEEPFYFLQLHKTEPNQPWPQRRDPDHVGREISAWFNLSSPAVSFLVG